MYSPTFSQLRAPPTDTFYIFHQQSMYFPTFSQLKQLFAPSRSLSLSVISQHTDKHAGSSLLRYYLVLFFRKQSYYTLKSIDLALINFRK